MSKSTRVAVVGCGAFGGMIALRLSEAGCDVTIFEREKECLRGASFNNQNRLHLGFHYPRDILTAHQCIQGFSRFREEFPECIVSGFPNLYFVQIPKYLRKRALVWESTECSLCLPLDPKNASNSSINALSGSNLALNWLSGRCSELGCLRGKQNPLKMKTE